MNDFFVNKGSNCHQSQIMTKGIFSYCLLKLINSDNFINRDLAHSNQTQHFATVKIGTNFQQISLASNLSDLIR